MEVHERSKADLFFFFLNLPHPTLLTVLSWPCVVDRILKSCYCLTTLRYLPQLTVLLLSSTVPFTAIFHSTLYCYLPQYTLLLSSTAHSVAIFHSPFCCCLPQHTLLLSYTAHFTVIFHSTLYCYLLQHIPLLSSSAHSSAIFTAHSNVIVHNPL